MKSVLVYCGSHLGKDEVYANAARELGVKLAQNNFRLIYGGGSTGIMGVIANAVLDGGGEVIGVRPEGLLNSEQQNRNCTELITVANMQERKVLLEKLADVIVALPGGYGSMDELFEALTNVQIGIHQKSIAILNIHGFYNHLVAQIDKMVLEGFIMPESRARLFVADTPEQLVKYWLGF